jgi:hypothetical protein
LVVDVPTTPELSTWEKTKGYLELVSSIVGPIITAGTFAIASKVYYKPNVLGHNHFYSLASSLIPKCIMKTTANIIKEADKAISAVMYLQSQYEKIDSQLVYDQLQEAIVNAIPLCKDALSRSEMMMNSAQEALAVTKDKSVEITLNIVTTAFEMYSKIYSEYSAIVKTSSKSESIELGEIDGTYAPIGIALSYDKIDLVVLDTSNVLFDYNDNGTKIKTSWIGSRDAFLIYDHNSNKKVDAAKELVLTKCSEIATTDFEALKEVFDSNKDNKFDANDAEFNNFMIWQDKNQDGISQSDELTSLLEAGLVQINFDTETIINGEFFGKQQDMNIVEVLWEDGHQTLAYDIMFETSSLDPITGQQFEIWS